MRTIICSSAPQSRGHTGQILDQTRGKDQNNRKVAAVYLAGIAVVPISQFTHSTSSVAGQPAVRGAVTRFIVPEKLNTGRPSAVSMPRIKMIERPARTTSPVPSTSSPL